MSNWVKNTEDKKLYDGLTTIISSNNLSEQDYQNNLTITLTLLGKDTDLNVHSFDSLFFKNGDAKTGAYTNLLNSCIANPIFYYFIMPRSRKSLEFSSEWDDPNRFLNRVEDVNKIKCYYKARKEFDLSNKSYIILWDDYIRERVPLILSTMITKYRDSALLQSNAKKLNFKSLQEYYDLWIRGKTEGKPNLTFQGYISSCIIQYMKNFFNLEYCIALSQICVNGKRALLNAKKDEYYIPNHVTEYILKKYRPYPCVVLFCILVLNVYINLYGKKGKDPESGLIFKQAYMGVDVYINNELSYSSPILENSWKKGLSQSYQEELNYTVNYKDLGKESYSFEFWATDYFSDREFCYNIFNESVNSATGLLEIDITNDLLYQKTLCSIFKKVIKKMLNIDYSDYNATHGNYYWMSHYDMCGAFNPIVKDMITELFEKEKTGIEYGILINNSNTFSGMREFNYDEIVVNSGLESILINPEGNGN